MKVKEKFGEGEIVIVGALQDVNTPENLVDFSLQVSKKMDKTVTILSRRVTVAHFSVMYGEKSSGRVFLQENEKEDDNIFLSIPKSGIIIVDNPDDYVKDLRCHKGHVAKNSVPELYARMIASLLYHAQNTGATIVVIINTPAVKDNDGRDYPDLRYVSGYCYFIDYCDRVFLWKKNGDDLELTPCHVDKSPLKNEVSNWLLRRDGEIFETEGDVAIDGEPSRELQLKNIVWLFEHTQREETKRHIIAFIRKLCITNGKPWETDYTDMALGSKLKNIAEYECDSAGYLEVYDYFDKVLFDFDEEFLHVSIGGEYHRLSGNRDLFFRISSEDFDWTKQITNFKSKVDISFSNEHITVDKYARERNPKVGTKDKGEGLWYFYG